jgi:hypothetical protein
LLATAASKFSVGCILVNTQTGLQYINVGSVASPSWRNSQGAVSQGATSATIATTGNTDIYVVVAETGTVANLIVTAGDRLRIRAAASGTLANTVTFPNYLLRVTVTA